MTILNLIRDLVWILVRQGNLQVDLLTETDKQVEQPLGSVAYSGGRQNRVKLLPEGF